MKSVEIVLKLFDRELFKKYDFRLIDKPLPACKNFELDERDYWEYVMNIRSWTNIYTWNI